MIKSNKSRKAGFTLMEVLVALTILAVMSTGMIQLATHSVQQADYLTDKTLATIVASNTLTEIELTRPWPDVKFTPQEIEMGGKKWYVTVLVTPTASEDMKKLEVQVAPAGNSPPGSGVLATLIGFIGQH